MCTTVQWLLYSSVTTIRRFSFHYLMAFTLQSALPFMFLDLCTGCSFISFHITLHTLHTLHPQASWKYFRILFTLCCTSLSLYLLLYSDSFHIYFIFILAFRIHFAVPILLISGHLFLDFFKISVQHIRNFLHSLLSCKKIFLILFWFTFTLHCYFHIHCKKINTNMPALVLLFLSFLAQWFFLSNDPLNWTLKAT